MKTEEIQHLTNTHPQVSVVCASSPTDRNLGKAFPWGNTPAQTPEAPVSITDIWALEGGGLHQADFGVLAHGEPLHKPSQFKSSQFKS